MHEEPVQVAVFNTRVSSPDNGSLIAEMGGGEGNLVELLGVHYSIELLALTTVFIGMALDSNPEHFPDGAGAFDIFMADKALYGRGIMVVGSDGTASESHVTQAIPLYGLVRPRKQLFTWSILNASLATGITAEVYYRSFSEHDRVTRETVNRKYGKYRRS